MALRVTEQHTAADEPVLHTPLSTAPHGASRPSAASPLVSKKLALHVTDLRTAAVEHLCTLRCPQHRKAPRNRLRHLPWCQRSWRCTPSSCTQLWMSTCCTLRCTQHRKAPHNCQRHLPWCRGSWRCTSLSCTQPRTNTCCTLRCPRHRKAPLNRQRHLHWCRKELALHVTELHAPTAAAEPVLHAPLSTAPPGALQPSVASPLVSNKLASHVTKLHAEAAAAEHMLHTPLSTAPQVASQPSAASPMVSKKLALHVTELHASTAAAEHVLPRTPRACTWLRQRSSGGNCHRHRPHSRHWPGPWRDYAVDIAHLHGHRTLLMVVPAVVWRRLPPAPFSLAAMALAMAGRHGRHRSSPRSPEAFSWMSRQSSGRKPPPAPASLAAMALVLARRRGRHRSSPRSPKAAHGCAGGCLEETAADIVHSTARPLATV